MKLVGTELPPRWNGTPFADLLSELSRETGEWPEERLRAASREETSRAKIARDRRAHQTALKHLYRAQAYRVLASRSHNDDSDGGDIIRKIARELDEVGDYQIAVELGKYGRVLAIRSKLDPVFLAESCLQISTAEFHIGNLEEARNWIDEGLRLAPPDNPRFLEFEPKLRLAELALAALHAPCSESGDSDALRARAAELISAQDFVDGVRLLVCAESAGTRAKDLGALYRSQFDLGTLLYQRCRLYDQASHWFVKAFHSGLSNSSAHEAAEALIKAGYAKMEAGDRPATARLLEDGLGDLGQAVLPVPGARILALTAFNVAPRDPEASRGLLLAAKESLESVPTEEVLEWALAYGRLFIRQEYLDLAVQCLDVGFSRVADGVYYSPRVASLFQEFAHTRYLKEDWLACLLTIHEGRNRSHAHNDADGEAAAYSHASRMYRDIGELAIASQCIQKAMDLATGVSNPKLLREIQSLASEMMFNLQAFTEIDVTWNSSLQVILDQPPGSDDFNQSFLSLQSFADQVGAKRLPEDLLRAPFIYRSYGVALDRAGRQKEARNYLFRASRMHKALKDYPQAATAIHEYAVACARLSYSHAARRGFLIALSYKRKFGSTTGDDADSLLGYVKASIIVRDARGLTDYLQALERAVGTSNVVGAAYAFLTIAEGYQLLGTLDQATRFLDVVERDVVKMQGESKILTLVELSKLQLALNRAGDALRSAEEALALVEQTRGSIVGPNRHEWQRYGTPVLYCLLNAAYQVGHSEADLALKASELVKARSLLDRLGLTRMLLPEEIPEEVRIKDEELRTRSKDLLYRFQQSNSPPPDLLHDIAEIEKEQRALLDKVPSQFIDYLKTRQGIPLDPAVVTREKLSSQDTEVIAILPGEDGAYVWHLDGDGTARVWYRVDLSARQLSDMASAISNDMLNKQGRSVHLDELLTRLLGPILVALNRGSTLCLVVGGQLLQVPFAAAWFDGAYLLERHPIAILPSFSIAGYWRGSPSVCTTAVVLGDSLGDLRHARAEASTVAATLGVTPLLGEEVTRDRVAREIAGCSVLHVACHAAHDLADSLDSGIVLSDRSLFKCRDLGNIAVRATFAFLSACDSGQMMVASGDELVGLAPSFLMCGFDAVASALWKVPDPETRVLVECFYEEAVLNPTNLARCLQCAQLRLLRSDRDVTQPYYWGAWQLTGNWRAQIQHPVCDANCRSVEPQI
jgi:CHAT domain-containing protein/tetratricopeptide (TPR) repeat protein